MTDWKERDEIRDILCGHMECMGCPLDNVDFDCSEWLEDMPEKEYIKKISRMFHMCRSYEIKGENAQILDEKLLPHLIVKLC